MMVRLTLAATALAVGAAAVLPPTTSYRIEIRRESRVDLSAFGQPEQVQNENSVWFVTISYTDSAGGSVMHAVLDSVQLDSPAAPLAQEELANARGTAYHGFLDGRRKLVSVSRDKETLLGSQFEAVLRGFHPVVQPGASGGESWIDTLEVEIRSQQMNTKSNSVRTYTHGGEQVWEGTPSIKVDMSASEQSSGTLETPGGPADIQGKTTGTGTFYVGRDGRYLGGTTAGTGEASVTGAFAPSAIPVRSTVATTITMLK